MHEFVLGFEGKEADDHKLDFYDAAQAMVGFQRSLAITTHLILNDQVIVQAPSLKKAKILVSPIEEGSWKLRAAIITGLGIGVYNITTAPRDSVLGHLIHSAYDYVISESLGFHVDYDKSLGQQYEELKDKETNLPILNQSKFDSAIEKCEKAIKDMHRPIYSSGTAKNAKIYYRQTSEDKQLECQLTQETYDHLNTSLKEEDSIILSGRVSSYNINTYKGRIYVPEEKRPISFELADKARKFSATQKITKSLSENAIDNKSSLGNIEFEAYRNTSITGRTKKYFILDVK